MHRALFAAVAALGLLLLTARGFALTAADITAEAAVLIVADTGQILFDKNMNTRRHPASITKIMTGLLAMEHCAPDEMIEVSGDAVKIPYDSSHVALSPGEKLPVDSAMYALMLPSANDAANALAEHVAGTQAAFARMMTERAAELGAVNTNFTNPHGLDETLHYTTALDMALITREAIRNEGFLRYFGTARHTIPATNLQPKERPFTNQQFMLLPEMWVFNPDVLGGKVGYTDEARHTMSTAARRDGRTLVAVVLGCGIDEKFYDTKALFDYGFEELVPVKVPAERLEGLSSPILDPGEEIGEAAYFAEAPTLLVPAGTEAGDLLYEYHIPESLAPGEVPEASVSVSLARSPGGGVPALLLELPLSPSIRHYGAAPVGLGLSDGEGAPAGPAGGETALRALALLRWPALAAGALLLLVAVRKARIERRRAKRMRRLERIARLRGKT